MIIVDVIKLKQDRKSDPGHKVIEKAMLKMEIIVDKEKGRYMYIKISL